MHETITIWTLDWVPMTNGPAGFVRDMRLRWACEEAGLPYSVRTVPLGEGGPDHLARQPFGQVPLMSDGDLHMFESGACVLHLAEKSETLMPRDRQARAETLQWVFAALNSIEMVSVPWWFLEVTGATENGLTDWLESRLAHVERTLKEREWLAAGRFTIADLMMTDVLRVAKLRAFGDRPATEAFVERVMDQPAFKKAYTDQMEHFEAADTARRLDES
ncbi:glutathione S-transferase family protein [Pseudosulfitobacter sp. DSM 107133]|uniref:glutathione S-transferase family protein n=1 Tax=Pseudosulfitobacter sp. DSM 107133 TaxID=2883100 RepID=UPI000DF2132F|nr:glutathione S-transferase family protein [Pseudosulfitobacter sp. DSM 107133]UOA28230.1 Disulfide-bond oxidoreductase YfcG [Pseudosulfitobacter sp. DSM 107133]